MVHRSCWYHFPRLRSIEIGCRTRNWSHFGSIERTRTSNTHHFEQGRSSASRRIVARPKCADLEYFTVDVIAAATNHVHRVDVVASIRREYTHSIVVGTREATVAGFIAGYRSSYWKQNCQCTSICGERSCVFFLLFTQKFCLILIICHHF